MQIMIFSGAEPCRTIHAHLSITQQLLFHLFRTNERKKSFQPPQSLCFKGREVGEEEGEGRRCERDEVQAFT